MYSGVTSNISASFYAIGIRISLVTPFSIRESVVVLFAPIRAVNCACVQPRFSLSLLTLSPIVST